MNEAATNESLEIQTSLRLFNLVGLIKQNMCAVEKIFDKRFGSSNWSTEIHIRNGIKRNDRKKEKTEGRKFVKNLDLAILSVTSMPIFDLKSGFKIIHGVTILVKDYEWEISSKILLRVTDQTPQLDPWSITIFQSDCIENGLAAVEKQISEWLQKHIEHAKTFNAENPLEATPCEAIYPRIYELFTTAKWNDALATLSHYEQYSPEFYERFENEVNTIRHEVYALEKAQSAEENPHE